MWFPYLDMIKHNIIDFVLLSVLPFFDKYMNNIPY